MILVAISCSTVQQIVDMLFSMCQRSLYVTDLRGKKWVLFELEAQGFCTEIYVSSFICLVATN